MKELSSKEKEEGTVLALMERAAHRRIPRLLRIKASVDQGARLSDYQIRFLTAVFEDAHRAIPYFDRHPEVQDIATRMTGLYHHITEQAIANEEAFLKKKAPRIELPD